MYVVQSVKIAKAVSQLRQDVKRKYCLTTDLIRPFVSAVKV